MLGVNKADELRRVGEAWSCGSTTIMVSRVATWLSSGSRLRSSCWIRQPIMPWVPASSRPADTAQRPGRTRPAETAGPPAARCRGRPRCCAWRPAAQWLGPDRGAAWAASLPAWATAAQRDAAGGRAALALSLRRALEEGGVTFTKLGQLLSTRSDLLPDEFIAELAQLQDRAEPAPWEQVEEVITQSLGTPVGEVFAELRPEPAAAASIAQVHKARLRSGDGKGAEVAVKVERPGIRVAVEQYLDILLRLAVTLEDRAPWARAVGAADVARGFAAAMREELDFRIEARNMAAITATWSDQQHAAGGSVQVVLPAVHEQLCTEHVLVIEWLDGVSLRGAGHLIDERGLDRAELTRTLLRSMVYQITEGGVFHADPHPGTIMVLTDGRLALLDFGSVGRLDTQQPSARQNLLLALGHGDPAALRDALLELVTRSDDIDEQQLERVLGQFVARHLVGGTAATTEMFTDLSRPASRFELTIPPEIATVLRALGTLEGTLTLLTPQVDIAAEARQYAADRVAWQVSPAVVRKTAADELIALVPVLRRLPRKFDRVTSALEQGRLSVNVRLFADERDRRVVTGLTHQFLLAFLGAIRHRRRTAAWRIRRPQGRLGRQPQPGHRLQPARRRRHPRPASALHNLQEPVSAGSGPPQLAHGDGSRVR